MTLQPAARYTAIALGVFVASCSGSAQVMVGPHAVVTQFSDGATQLAATSGGVWFSTALSVSGVGHVGAVTNSLKVKLIALGGIIDHFSGGIAVASDGDVWFSEQGGQVAGKPFDSTQDFVSYMRAGNLPIRRIPIPSLGALPGNIAIASNGKVFVCEEAAGAVGEVLRNKIVEHRLPSGASGRVGGPYAIAVWRNGVYVIDDATYSILLLHTNGSWSEALGATSEFATLASTKAGVWFSDPASRELGFISKGRRGLSVSRVSVPWGAVPVGLAADASGVFFTTGEAFFGRYTPRRGFSKIPLPHYDGYHGYPDVLAVSGKRLWYSYQLSHVDTTGGAIGFVTI